MSDSKFTKGEWIKTGQFTVKIGDDESYLTTQQTGNYFAPVGEREANASLIAKAPDMYYLLEDIAKSNCRTDEFYEDILKILSEIRGEHL
jgi:hypothetical protein